MGIAQKLYFGKTSFLYSVKGKKIGKRYLIFYTIMKIAVTQIRNSYSGSF